MPISAADVARLLEAMGVDRVIAVDLHCGQIQGFFSPRVPVDNLAAGSVGVECVHSRLLPPKPQHCIGAVRSTCSLRERRDRLQVLSAHEIEQSGDPVA